MSRLHLIGERRNPAQADVIFVHGLGGHHQDTWLAAGQSVEDCWPRWLAADLPEANVWSLDYPAAISRWRGRSMPIPQRARNVLTVLEQSEIGARPIVFLCHSLGGLVVKKALHLARDGTESARQLLGNVRGIVYMGTPSAGASVATWGVRARLAFGLAGGAARLSSLIEEMRRANPYLLELRDWYADNAKKLGIANLVFYETQPVRGILTVVQADSADLGIDGVERIPFDADHFEICKFLRRDDANYRKVVSFTKAALARPKPSQTSRPSAPGPAPADAASAPARPFTVPEPVADFTGREAELAELDRALAANGRAAICAVNGMGGVGKSQLAFELARRTAARFPDGQVYLDMRGTAPDPLTPEAALADLIRAVHPDAKPPDDLASLKALYLQAWRGRRALLLLDNARDEEQVRDLAPPAPAALLVTSRRHILPEGGRTLTLDVLPEPQALALLREVLRAARPLADEEARALAEECGRLPLALRAAAGFLLRRRGWSVAEYLEELRGRGLAALDRVETVLGLSLGRLAEEDEGLARRFALLAAFPAGFDAEAAAAVWQAEPRAARDGLDALAEWSLVGVEAAGRYRLHDLVRDLAAGRASPAALEDARERHAAHYAEVLARADRLYLSGGAGVLAGLALFDAERTNVEAGQRWAAGGAAGGSDATRRLAAAYAGAGVYVLSLRLTPQQQIAWHEAALAACRRLGDQGGEGNALGNLGVAWAEIGEARRAIGYFEQQLAISREIGDRRGEGSSLGNLGIAWKNLGEAHEAIGYYEQALAISREIGDRRGEGAALGNLGVAWATLGEARKAVGYFEQRLAVAREIGDRGGEGNALGGLGLAWAALGEARKAIDHYEQWLAITREIGDRRGEGAVLFNSAVAYEKLGERDKALANARAALAIFRAIESPHVATVEAWLRARGIDP